MTTDTQELIAFRLTGKHPAHAIDEVNGDTCQIAAGQELRPVLFASYSDLTSLRYDFPLILINDPRTSTPILSLTDAINKVIGKLAPKGTAGEFDRSQILELEQQIRIYAASGAKSTLSKLWKKAQTNLVRAADRRDRKTLKTCLEQAGKQIGCDGEIVDCDERAGERILEHIWALEVAVKASRFQKRVGALIIRLERILEADFEISGKAQEPEVLKRAVGDALASSFDFKALSDLLQGSDTHDVLPKTRVERIKSVLRVMKTQRFFAAENFDTDAQTSEPKKTRVHKYIFNSCTKAHDAFLDRLPEAVELVKAISIAELEIVNGYKPDFHNGFFSNFDQTSLVQEDLELFPPCLAICRGETWGTAEEGRIVETLLSGLPIKIVVQTSDLLTLSPVGAEPFARGLQGTRLAGLAVGLGSAYVLQSATSNLYQVRDQLETGLGLPGAALFSLYSGQSTPSDITESTSTNEKASYLTSAAAMEARAFPAFAFNPLSGKNLATRFSLLSNSEPHSDWMTWSMDCEDDDLQRETLNFTFTFADFMAMDTRYRDRFIKISKEDWVEEMIPVGDYVNLPLQETENKIPYVLMINTHGHASRYAVDDTVVRATMRINKSWRDLQELGGINNSHAQIRLTEEREVWRVEKERDLKELQMKLEVASAAAISASRQGEEPSPAEVNASAPVVGAPIPQKDTAPTSLSGPQTETTPEQPDVQNDDTWIETARCTTCNECTDLNNQIFAYDDNMQAYIADADAGSFRDIVLAAENCQVAIIHPGKPRNANEPDLTDLVKRAELFK